MYNVYATKYDDVIKVTGFNDASMMIKYLLDKDYAKDQKVVDFGCGTGIVGEGLTKEGFTDITAVDGSTEMLAVSKAKGVYKSLHECLIGFDPLDDLLKDQIGSFDIVITSATMLKGHFPNTCYKTFLEYLKPGGIMIFSIRDIYLNSETDFGMNYHGAMEELVQANLMKKVDSIPYTKFQGLSDSLGDVFFEGGANILVFSKI